METFFSKSLLALTKQASSSVVHCHVLEIARAALNSICDESFTFTLLIDVGEPLCMINSVIPSSSL
ncbi:hypothetical protein T10_9401 [Trichinella papuae]|uniref:Uncharacterized protein n=1 Tax=Trichinella papuae TaxID=268474 RepID=A0A0V1MZG0_9BILA|nr:hypothetical protein T10_9401 [Trichinella papuae]